MSEPPAVLFVCVRNRGKSQLAAALARALAGDAVEVHSAGTQPGGEVNELCVQVLAEVGIDIGTEAPKPIDPALLRRVDHVVTLGREARVDPVPGANVVNWDTDEPSERGIEGIDRMRLVRDDIDRRVRGLLAELGVPPRR
ncbi:low molecular weight phosphatase family protein [Mycolicibacterium sp. 050158]|jgi:arsenate-mycothiol transferase|uniref:arsenate-mycothiol transferase ArsC n=1 Tax=Mycolicibacterium sp. 050158 TaxID=3090602 RepID=UPI00299D7EB9|nr:low molecular weight phosphatase family protein [Mycolicibacterium sp. 050158]MDX1890819.1 low molecular weight phosphatase family protein [Mycolicibacterium sp. 050158]